jgi:hypothetical protein
MAITDTLTTNINQISNCRREFGYTVIPELSCRESMGFVGGNIFAQLLISKISNEGKPNIIRH